MQKLVSWVCQILEAQVGKPRCCGQWTQTTVYIGVVNLEAIKVFL